MKIQKPTKAEIEAANERALQLSEATIQKMNQAETQEYRDFLYNWNVLRIAVSDADPEYVIENCLLPMQIAKTGDEEAVARLRPEFRNAAFWLRYGNRTEA